MAILSAGILSFLGILDETATTVIFPALEHDFGITTDQVQWVNTIVLLVIATIVPLSSQIRLRWSTKKIFVIGVLFFLGGLIVDIFAQRFDLLLLGRALQGIGTGVGLPLMYNIILAKVPKEQLGFMMGIGTMITAAAVALGPVFGGTVSEVLSWRWIFIISFGMMLIGLLIGIYSITQLNDLKKVHFSFFQWLALALGLVFLMVGFTNIAKNKFFSWQVAGLFLGGSICLLIWLRTSWTDQQALIKPQLFGNITFGMQLICYCIDKIATLALGTTLPLYIQVVNHSSVSLAGWIVLPGAIADAIMAAIAGKLYDKKGRRLPIIAGLILSLMGLILLVVLGKQLTNLEILCLYAIYYAGYGMSFSSLMTSGLTALGSADHAQGNAIFNTLQQFSGAIGTALAGTMIALSQNNSNPSSASSAAQGSWQTFIILLVMIMLGLLISVKFVPSDKVK